MNENILTSASLAALLLELVKMLVRWVIKLPSFDFSPKFYLVALPVMQVLAAVILAFLGVTEYAMPADWLEWLRSLVLVILSSAVSFFVYEGGVSKFKAYAAMYRKPLKAKRAS